MQYFLYFRFPFETQLCCITPTGLGTCYVAAWPENLCRSSWFCPSCLYLLSFDIDQEPTLNFTKLLFDIFNAIIILRSVFSVYSCPPFPQVSRHYLYWFSPSFVRSFSVPNVYTRPSFKVQRGTHIWLQCCT